MQDKLFNQHSQFPDNSLYLFILWGNAEKHWEMCESLIEDNFKIILSCLAEFPEEDWQQNLWRFYNVHVTTIVEKISHYGMKPFKVIVVTDSDPIFEVRPTSDGHRKINSRVWDLKQRLRKLTSEHGDGYLVHSSVTPIETRHDLSLLFGANFEDRIVKLKAHHKATPPQPLKLDFAGTKGWNSLEEVFEIANVASNYVVLRSFSTLPHAPFQTDHIHDIDVMTDNRDEFVKVINGKKIHSESYRVQYRTLVNGEFIDWDVRETTDGFLPEEIAKNCLMNKKMNNSIFISSEFDRLISLIYFVVIHKGFVPENYSLDLSTMELPEYLSQNLTLESLYSFLLLQMASFDVDFETPKDLSVVNLYESDFLNESKRSIQNFAKSTLLANTLSRNSEVNPWKELDTILKSKSWRITKPLRDARSWIQRARLFS